MSRSPGRTRRPPWSVEERPLLARCGEKKAARQPEAIRCDAGSVSTSAQWGLPALEQWYFEASPFAGVALQTPDIPLAPMTLERFLLERTAK